MALAQREQELSVYLMIYQFYSSELALSKSVSDQWSQAKLFWLQAGGKLGTAFLQRLCCFSVCRRSAGRHGKVAYMKLIAHIKTAFYLILIFLSFFQRVEIYRANWPFGCYYQLKPSRQYKPCHICCCFCVPKIRCCLSFCHTMKECQKALHNHYKLQHDYGLVGSCWIN